MATKAPREVENREFSERPKTWAPPELLPEPDKQAGFEYRWIRVSMLNQADPRNLSSKMREGWEPVMAEEQPSSQPSLIFDERLRGSAWLSIETRIHLYSNPDSLSGSGSNSGGAHDFGRSSNSRFVTSLVAFVAILFLQF